MPSASKKPRSVPEQIFRFFSSFALAGITMVLLVIVTLLGTLEQKFNGLYDSQTKWFDSFVVTSFEYLKDAHLPLILPGGYLLMLVLSVNILCGALIRARKSWDKPGMVIAHSSILFMLLAGLVSFYGKTDGNMFVWEGDTSNKVAFFHERIVEIEKYNASDHGGEGEAAPSRTSWAIPMRYFKDLKGSNGRKFTHAEFPFELTLWGFEKNSKPYLPSAADIAARRDAEGFTLKPLESDLEDSANMNGLYASLRPTKGGDAAGETRHILWEGSSPQTPLTVKVGDETYVIRLNKDYRLLPFEVTLDKATREFYPGTDRPKEFSSEITHIKTDGIEEERIISMNQPLRDEGWILFQSQFGASEAVTGAGSEYSVLQIVSNPSDHWPLYSLIVATAGLLIHFVQKLLAYMIRASRRREREAAATAD